MVVCSLWERMARVRFSAPRQGYRKTHSNKLVLKLFVTLLKRFEKEILNLPIRHKLLTLLGSTEKHKEPQAETRQMLNSLEFKHLPGYLGNT